MCRVSATGVEMSLWTSDRLDCLIRASPGDGVGVAASKFDLEIGTSLMYSYVDGVHKYSSHNLAGALVGPCDEKNYGACATTIGNDAPKAVAKMSDVAAEEMSVVNGSEKVVTDRSTLY